MFRYRFMRIIFLLYFFILISCNANKKEEIKPIPDPSLENPWTYINRISDTLPETEFSLFNSIPKNLENHRKYGTDFLSVKYRVHQNQYLKVDLKAIESYEFPGLGFEDEFYIGINYLGEFMHSDYYGQDLNTIDTAFQYYISSTFNEEYIGKPNARFYIQLMAGANQSILTEILNHLAYGYLLFLDEFSIKKHKISLKHLSAEKQNEIMKSIPLTLNYNFYSIYPRELKVPEML